MFFQWNKNIPNQKYVKALETFFYTVAISCQRDFQHSILGSEFGRHAFHQEKKQTHLEPQTAIYKCLAINWMIPNLYIGNGWKSPFPSIFNWLFGVPDPVSNGDPTKKHPDRPKDCKSATNKPHADLGWVFEGDWRMISWKSKGTPPKPPPQEIRP